MICWLGLISKYFLINLNIRRDWLYGASSITNLLERKGILVSIINFQTEMDPTLQLELVYIDLFIF